MKRVVGGPLTIVCLWLPALAALAALVFTVMLQIEWQRDCAGGRAANPAYNVAECWDIERTIVFTLSALGLFLIPVLTYLGIMYLVRQRAGRKADGD